jgi:hypothetical protein
VETRKKEKADGEPVAEAKAPATDNLENDASDNHGKTFKVKRHLQHNGTLHRAGADVREAMFTAEQIKTLLNLGVIEEVKEQEDGKA